MFLLIVKFAYNNIKNANIGYMPFELNCEYHLLKSYKKNINLHSNSKLINEL